MIGFVIRRLFLALVVCLIVSMIVFLGMRLLPADPLLIYISQSDQASYSPEKLAEMRHEMQTGVQIHLREY